MPAGSAITTSPTCTTSAIRRGEPPSAPLRLGRAHPVSASSIGAVCGAPAESTQPSLASAPLTSSVTANCQSASMPGGLGKVASERGQPVRNEADGSSRATGPRQPPCTRSYAIKPRRSTWSAVVCNAGSSVVWITSPPSVVASAPNRSTICRRTSSPNQSEPGTTSGRWNCPVTTGPVFAAAACSAVIALSSTMRSSTQSRRARAASGKRNGL